LKLKRILGALTIMLTVLFAAVGVNALESEAGDPTAHERVAVLPQEFMTTDPRDSDSATAESQNPQDVDTDLPRLFAGLEEESDVLTEDLAAGEIKSDELPDGDEPSTDLPSIDQPDGDLGESETTEEPSEDNELTGDLEDDDVITAGGDEDLDSSDDPDFLNQPTASASSNEGDRSSVFSIMSTTVEQPVPVGKLSYFIASPNSVKEFSGETVYLKTDKTADSEPGAYFAFYLRDAAKNTYTLLAANSHGNLIWNFGAKGSYTVVARLVYNSQILDEWQTQVRVVANPNRTPLNLAPVYVDRTALDLADAQPVYVRAVATAAGRAVQYQFYEVSSRGGLRWLDTNTHGSLLYSPSAAGEYQIRVTAVDSDGESLTALSSPITVSTKPINVEYFVTDPRDGKFILDDGNMFYAKIGVSGTDPLTYAFRLKKGAQQFDLETNDHGNLFVSLANIPVGSYVLEVEITNEHGDVARRTQSLQLSLPPFSLAYFIAAPTALKDSASQSFYLKGEAVASQSVKYFFYRMLPNLQAIYMYENLHGNYIYLPNVTGNLTLKCVALGADGRVAERLTQIQYAADPPVISQLTPNLQSYNLLNASNMYLKAHSNFASGKEQQFSYYVRTPDGKLNYLTTNQSDLLMYNFGTVGNYQFVVELTDWKDRKAVSAINVTVTERPMKVIPVLFLSPSNQPNNYYKNISTTERAQMELLAALIKTKLSAYEITVVLPDYNLEAARGWRTPGPNNEEAIKITGRPTDAKNINADFYLALHSNAVGSGTNTNSTGPLALYHPSSALSKSMANSLFNNLMAVNPPNGNTAGGIRSGMDAFAGRGYGEVRSPMELGIPSVLLEVNFHDNARTAAYIVNSRDQIAEQIAKSIVQTMNLQRLGSGSGSGGLAGLGTNINILGGPTATQAQAQAWATSKGAAAWFIEQIPTFWSVSITAGVDPVVTYVQSALETGYGNFTGVVTSDHHNTCGLKTKVGGGDYDKEAHAKFDSWRTGITAQVDHLALYAGQVGYPKTQHSSINSAVITYAIGYTSDPRHFSWIKGTAKTVKELGAKWAPSSSYGERLETLMRELWSF
jgi:N-acetylmuramoyl-L-alanine amidase